MNLYAKRSGVSVMEMMIVLMVIVFIVSFTLPRITSFMKRIDEEKTKLIMSDVNTGIIRYIQDVGTPPHHLKDLIVRPKGPEGAEWQGSYLPGKTSVPLDAAKKEFYYAAPPRKFKAIYKKYELCSINDDEDNDTSDRLRTGN